MYLSHDAKTEILNEGWNGEGDLEPAVLYGITILSDKFENEEHYFAPSMHVAETFVKNLHFLYSEQTSWGKTNADYIFLMDSEKNEHSATYSYYDPIKDENLTVYIDMMDAI